MHIFMTDGSAEAKQRVTGNAAASSLVHIVCIKKLILPASTLLLLICRTLIISK